MVLRSTLITGKYVNAITRNTQIECSMLVAQCPAINDCHNTPAR